MAGGDITTLLRAWGSGDESVSDELFQAIYGQLRSLARHHLRSGPGTTLTPTVLINEAFLQLVQQERVDWQGRAHFFAVASQMMRRLLVDHARARRADKRGGGATRISIDEGLGLSITRDADVMAIDEALTKLAAVDPRQAEIISLRFFGGLSVEEVAAVLDMSKRAVEAEWTMIKAWLRRELSDS